MATDGYRCDEFQKSSHIISQASHEPCRRSWSTLGTRERILVEGERLFRHFGYSKTNVADIARELGMSPANIYRFFPSKSAICEAIARRLLANRIAENEAIARGAGAVAERIKAVLINEHRLTVETLIDERRVHDMVVAAMTEQWHVIEEFLERTRGIYAGLIREGVENGEFPPQDAELSAIYLHKAFAIMCHPMLVVECLGDQDRAQAPGMADFIIRALRQGGACSSSQLSGGDHEHA